MTLDQLQQAQIQLSSLKHKINVSLYSLQQKDSNRYKSQITLALRRIEALELALELIEQQLEHIKTNP